MSEKLYRLILAEWSDHQPEVHPVWEARIIPSIEQVRELETANNADSPAIRTPLKADDSGTEVHNADTKRV